MAQALESFIEAFNEFLPFFFLTQTIDCLTISAYFSSFMIVLFDLDDGDDDEDERILSINSF